MGTTANRKRTDSKLAAVDHAGELLQAAAQAEQAAADMREEANESLSSAGGNVAIFPPAELPDDENDSVENVRAQLNAGGDGSFVTVTRIASNGRPGASLPRRDAKTFDVEDIRADHGAGTYRFIGYTPRTPGGKVSRFLDRTLTLEATVGAPKATQPEAANNDMLALIGAMQQGFNRLGELIAQATKAPTRAEMLEEMRIMRDMFAPPAAAAGASVTDQLGALESVMSLAEKFAERKGSGGDVDPVTDIIKTVIEQFAPALMPVLQARMTGAAPGAAPETPALPAPAATPAPSLPAAPAAASKPIVYQGEETDVNLLIQKAMMMQLRDLIEAAARQADPELYAEVILDKLPAASVVAFLSEPGWFAKVCELDARAAQYQPWFQSLSTAVQTQLTTEGDGGNTAA